jgi:hypothetical protein
LLLWSSVDLLSVLPVVQDQVLSRGIPVPGWRDPEAEHQRFASAVAQVLTELRLATGTGLPPGEAAKVLARAMTGIGVLQPLLEQDGVEEIIVRGGFVQIERRGVIEDVGNLAPDSHFEQWPGGPPIWASGCSRGTGPMSLWICRTAVALRQLSRRFPGGDGHQHPGFCSRRAVAGCLRGRL